uniref:Uncharacterized protein n=1 Tax=viral metagenome TaxID=1070528 RepID=A0A6C0FCY4_9ZZZZ|tara:strand:+ start:28111 stop:28362 length:252 start_codon:yes stop_codon:yes gene_type:complete
MLNNLNTYKTQLENSDLNTDWLEISELLGFCSQALKNKSKSLIGELLIKLIVECLKIAKTHDIDMLVAWDRWYKKVLYKQYIT